jgi:hypothetical protein
MRMREGRPSPHVMPVSQSVSQSASQPVSHGCLSEVPIIPLTAQRVVLRDGWNGEASEEVHDGLTALHSQTPFPSTPSGQQRQAAAGWVDDGSRSRVARRVHRQACTRQLHTTHPGNALERRELVPLAGLT